MDGRLIFLHHGRRFDGSGALAGRGSVPIRWSARKGEGVYDPELPGRTAKKNRLSTTFVSVLKLTQVGEMKILRRSR